MAVVMRYQQKHTDTLLQHIAERLHSLRSKTEALGDKRQSATDTLANSKKLNQELQVRVDSLEKDEETSDEEEVAKLKLKIKATEHTLAQREEALTATTERLRSLHGENKALGVKLKTATDALADSEKLTQGLQV